MTSLTISIVEDGYNDDLWESLTEIVQNLTRQKVNPLSTIELHTQAGPVAFWTALSTCHLTSLTLADLFVDEIKFPAFWKVCSTVKSIHLRNTQARADGHPAEPKFRKRFFRLKHLIMEGASALLWSSMGGKPALPWIRAPNLETVSLTGYETLHKSDLKNWVLDIDFAKQAADSGCMFYGRDGIEYYMEYEYYNAYELPDNGGDGLDDDQEGLEMLQYDGLIPGAKIHSFDCRYPPLDDCTISVLIGNMDSVQKMAVNRLKNAIRSLASLMAHLETLVELDLWKCYLTSTMVVRFLEECPRLQVFVGDVVESGVVWKSRPWTCVGMKKLDIEFYSEQELSEPLEFDHEQEHILERLAQMPCLETFSMPAYFYRFGLNHLRRLVQVHDVSFSSEAYLKLTVSDVKWMGQHWPRLKVVRSVSASDIRCRPEVMNAFAALGVSLSYTYH
ncbi:hypothetical protein BGZ74_009106 [Mortierella antarctica]|nr:hypothetical protein BGZ74_009106 [Mortierella antarctica]